MSHCIQVTTDKNNVFWVSQFYPSECTDKTCRKKEVSINGKTFTVWISKQKPKECNGNTNDLITAKIVENQNSTKKPNSIKPWPSLTNAPLRETNIPVTNTNVPKQMPAINVSGNVPKDNSLNKVIQPPKIGNVKKQLNSKAQQRPCYKDFTTFLTQNNIHPDSQKTLLNLWNVCLKEYQNEIFVEDFIENVQDKDILQVYHNGTYENAQNPRHLFDILLNTINEDSKKVLGKVYLYKKVNFDESLFSRNSKETNCSEVLAYIKVLYSNLATYQSNSTLTLDINIIDENIEEMAKDYKSYNIVQILGGLAISTFYKGFKNCFRECSFLSSAFKVENTISSESMSESRNCKGPGGKWDGKLIYKGKKGYCYHKSVMKKDEDTFISVNSNLKHAFNGEYKKYNNKNDKLFYENADMIYISNMVYYDNTTKLATLYTLLRILHMLVEQFLNTPIGFSYETIAKTSVKDVSLVKDNSLLLPTKQILLQKKNRFINNNEYTLWTIKEKVGQDRWIIISQDKDKNKITTDLIYDKGKFSLSADQQIPVNVYNMKSGTDLV